jgi:hypothetical protein
VAGAAVSLAVSACGGGARQDAHQPSGRFTVEVPSASFPASQSLSQHTRMVIIVRNPGPKSIPNVAITITDAIYNTSAQAFGYRTDQANVANASRPVWIVDQGPGASGCQFSCQSGGAGGAVTAYSNTWALGALGSGQTATFTWHVTAVKQGTHVVHYRVAAGLNGNAVAQLASGQPPEGSFVVKIRQAPQQAYVTNSGKLVTTP